MRYLLFLTLLSGCSLFSGTTDPVDAGQPDSTLDAGTDDDIADQRDGDRDGDERDVDVTVIDNTVTTLQFSENNYDVPVGERVDIEVLAFNAAMERVTTPPMMFMSSNPNVGIIESNQLVGLTPGTTVISATAGELFVSIQATVANTFSAIATGTSHTCALNPNGQIICWGNNTYRQLSDGSRVDRWFPALSNQSAPPMTSLFAGGNRTCGLTGTGDAYCWGKVPGSVGSWESPTKLVDNSIARISVGTEHVCVVTINDRLICEGENEFSQVDPASPPERIGDIEPFPDTAFQTVSAGESHTCAVSGDDVWCWGSNVGGQLGGVPTDNLFVSSHPGVSEVVAGKSHTCILADGNVTCWGEQSKYTRGLVDGVLDLPEDIERIVDTLGDHTCVETATQFLCFGDNSVGQLGTGNIIDISEPVPHSFDVMTTSKGRSCGLNRGIARCWGENLEGALGTGDNRSVTIPTPVLPALEWHDISVDVNGSFLLTSSTANNAIPLDLASYGIEPGNTIILRSIGDYQPNENTSDYLARKTGLFSTSSDLLAFTEFDRVPGAIQTNLETINTPSYEGTATDIPQDFEFVSGPITIPENARFLFLSTGDSTPDNNSDPDVDCAARIVLLPAP